MSNHFKNLICLWQIFVKLNSSRVNRQFNWHVFQKGIWWCWCIQRQKVIWVCIVIFKLKNPEEQGNWGHTMSIFSDFLQKIFSIFHSEYIHELLRKKCFHKYQFSQFSKKRVLTFYHSKKIVAVISTSLQFWGLHPSIKKKYPSLELIFISKGQNNFGNKICTFIGLLNLISHDWYEKKLLIFGQNIEISTTVGSQERKSVKNLCLLSTKRLIRISNLAQHSLLDDEIWLKSFLAQ